MFRGGEEERDERREGGGVAMWSGGVGAEFNVVGAFHASRQQHPNKLILSNSYQSVPAPPAVRRTFSPGRPAVDPSLYSAQPEQPGGGDDGGGGGGGGDRPAAAAPCR